MDGNYAVGVNPATIRERYQEAHDLIKKAWAEPEVFAWNGKFHKLRYVNIWPRPIQYPSPPVWIPGGGSIETWDFCAENHYNYSYLSFSGYLRG
jgi:alkanesulfonate monooxygenase SsuD/methylene tetrahydromethanopterin reductase-like flavin-dependent oxidoreductase (luciferase family)